MAGKKKTNYISYELKKLDLYLGQLQDFLDKNPPNLATDRVEILTNGRGGETLKVIASIEDQVKMFLTALEKLPKVLEDVNRLRKEVDQDKKEVELRGGYDRPGFMDDDDDEEEDQKEKPKKKNNKKESPSNTNAFDDDEFYGEDKKEEEQEEKPEEQSTKLKELPPSEDDDQGDSDWLDEMEEF